MAERLIFLTGHLARARLERLLVGLGETEFAWEIVDIGVKVAALMTEDIIKRRLKLPEGADRVILPGRYRGDLERLSAHFGAPFRARTRRDRRPAGLSRPGRRAAGPFPPRHAHLRRDRRCADALGRCAGRRGRGHLQDAGADVIDLGCLPETPFPLAWRGGAGTEGARVFRQRRLGQPG